MKNILFLSYLTLPDERPQSFLLSNILKELKKDKKYKLFLLTNTKKNILINNEYFFNYSLNDKPEFFFGKFAFFKYIKILFPNLFYKDLLNKINQITQKNKIDLIISYSNPYYLNSVANYFCKNKKYKFFSHYSDPFLDSSYNQISFLLKPFLKILEKSILKNSSKVIFCNKKLKNFVLSKHNININKKTKVIPHFFVKKKNKISKVKNRKKDIFAYFGSFYGPRQPNELITAINELNKIVPDFKKNNIFLFYGYNNLGFFDEKLLNNIPENVVFKNSVKQSELFKLTKNIDFLISIDAKNIENIYLPSKIIEYFSFKKPILAISNLRSPSHELSRNTNITFANINSINDIKKKILLIKKNKKIYDYKKINFFDLNNIIQIWKKEIN